MICQSGNVTIAHRSLSLGFFGLIMAPIVRNDGVLTTFSDESLHTLLWNLTGGAVLAGYSLVTATILFWTLDRMGVLRVNVNAEVRGLDILKHNEPAYGYGIQKTKIHGLLGKFFRKFAKN